jgi:thymidylate synthase (FAD)
MVRHRICSFTQESTRYCNYSKTKFGSEITVIEPFFWAKEKCGVTTEYKLWFDACEAAEKAYLKLLEIKALAQEARSVLPNSLKTKIVVTANVREWRKIFELRTTEAAHPQIKQIMCPTLAEFRLRWPTLFDDVGSIEHPSPAFQVLPNQAEK